MQKSINIVREEWLHLDKSTSLDLHGRRVSGGTMAHFFPQNTVNFLIFNYNEKYNSLFYVSFLGDYFIMDPDQSDTSKTYSR